MSMRSHYGCARCKKRRQKCDEGKPSCAQCRSSGVACAYLLTLKWNGRVPRTNTLRKTTVSRRCPVNTEPPSRQQPVYHAPQSVDGTSTGQRQNARLALEAEREPDPGQTDATKVQAMRMVSPPSPPRALTLDVANELLYHYVTKASRLLPDRRIRDIACSQVLPLASEKPSLMYALMALSALNRTTLTSGVPETFILEPEVVALVIKSAQALRLELQDGCVDALSCLQTVRTLCTCEIFSGKADSTWRVHINGARALLDLHSHLARDGMTGSTGTGPGANGWLMSRWYTSIKALTALTPRGLISGQDSSWEGDEDDCLDMYTGCSSDLSQVQREVGAVAWECRRRQSKHQDLQPSTSPDGMRVLPLAQDRVSPHAHSPGNSLSQDVLLSDDDLKQEGTMLEWRISWMIERDETLGLRTAHDFSLSTRERARFEACNRAYQYATLLYLRKEILGMQTNAPESQTCVKRILAAATSILPVQDLSPWVLLTTPLYIAG